MNSPTDAELVAAVLAGDADGFALLVERHQAMLFRHAVALTGDPDAAADLVQDAFIKSYTHLATCADPARYGAWVFRILRNRCLDYRKDLRQRRTPIDDVPHLAAGDDPARDADRADAVSHVAAALARLPAAQREAFVLKHVEDLSYEEMAERLGASISALKMRVLRAREALAAMLADEPGA